jgi:hypothetical protein
MIAENLQGPCRPFADRLPTFRRPIADLSPTDCRPFADPIADLFSTKIIIVTPNS